MFIPCPYEIKAFLQGKSCLTFNDKSKKRLHLANNHLNRNLNICLKNYSPLVTWLMNIANLLEPCANGCVLL